MTKITALPSEEHMDKQLITIHEGKTVIHLLDVDTGECYAKNKKTGEVKQLVVCTSNSGYSYVPAHSTGKPGDIRYLHRFVAGCKHGDKKHVHHIDGNKKNNSPSNLQVMSAREHRIIHSRKRDLFGVAIPIGVQKVKNNLYRASVYDTILKKKIVSSCFKVDSRASARCVFALLGLFVDSYYTLHNLPIVNKAFYSNKNVNKRALELLEATPNKTYTLLDDIRHKIWCCVVDALFATKQGNFTLTELTDEVAQVEESYINKTKEQK